MATAPFNVANPVFRNEKKQKLSDDEAIEWTDNIWQPGSGATDAVTMSMHKSWLVYVAYFLGITDFKSTDILADVDPNMIPTVTPYQVNLIFRFVQQTVAQLSRARPSLEVIPETPDIDDQIAAKIGEKFLEHYFEALGMRQMKAELAYWCATCGTAFSEACFEKSAGVETEVFKNPFSGTSLGRGDIGEEQMDLLRRIGSTKTMRPGEMEGGALAPFQVILPPQHKSMSTLPWVMIQRLVSVDWIWDRYPKIAPKLSAGDLASSEDNFYWQKLSHLVARQGTTFAGAGWHYDENTVLLKDYWHAPSGRYPNGFFVRRTKDLLLENEPHPVQKALKAKGLDLRERRWRADRFPIQRHVFAEAPGRIWGVGIVEHLIGLQNEYNHARHQMNAQRDLFSQPQWLIPRNSEVTPWHFEYGDGIEYNIGQGKPELINPPTVPMAFVEATQQTLRDMQTIAAQSEASQGQVPQGARSGVALESLQERDELAISPAVASMEIGLQAYSQHLLMLTWLHVDNETMVRTYGQFQAADVEIFKGSELRGNVMVRIQPGSMMPKSRATSLQIMFQAVQSGILQPMNPKHQEMMLKVLEIGDVDSMFFELSLQRRRATVENQMFSRPVMDEMTGQPRPFPDVQDFDDHAVHIEEHTKMMLTDEFELWPIMRKLAFQAHVAKHQRVIAQMVQTQMMLQGMGSPGGGSEPKQPGEASQPRERQPTPGSREKLQSA